ncbi:unnamed protein product [Protopolystoma xenopodis]|uniref:Uncharacterized protein n=1 Tax=Protopolystoma xenopodis TaxID=117903 RepID=A0A3S4ZKY6_9PLAT|nr:unnamed protein product [Protopolystoma xenopodis]
MDRFDLASTSSLTHYEHQATLAHTNDHSRSRPFEIHALNISRLAVFASFHFLNSRKANTSTPAWYNFSFWPQDLPPCSSGQACVLGGPSPPNPATNQRSLPPIFPLPCNLNCVQVKRNRAIVDKWVTMRPTLRFSIFLSHSLTLSLSLSLSLSLFVHGGSFARPEARLVPHYALNMARIVRWVFILRKMVTETENNHKRKAWLWSLGPLVAVAIRCKGIKIKGFHTKWLVERLMHKAESVFHYQATKQGPSHRSMKSSLSSCETKGIINAIFNAFQFNFNIGNKIGRHVVIN